MLKPACESTIIFIDIFLKVGGETDTRKNNKRYSGCGELKPIVTITKNLLHLRNN